MRRKVRGGRRFAGGVTLLLVLGAAGLAAQDPEPPPGEGPPAGALVGDRSKRQFHRADCSMLKRVPARLRTELTDAEAAEAKGFKPCPVCKPGGEGSEPGSDDAKAP